MSTQIKDGLYYAAFMNPRKPKPKSQPLWYELVQIEGYFWVADGHIRRVADVGRMAARASLELLGDEFKAKFLERASPTTWRTVIESKQVFAAALMVEIMKSGMFDNYDIISEAEKLSTKS